MDTVSADRRRWLVWLLAAAALVVGWREFWFLCDDAYIAFRYVAARHAGWGYTWNPPPFPAVEGYSSFLWVLTLDGVWSVLGVAPPAAAPVLSLLCVGWTAWSVGRIVESAPLPPAWAPHRVGLLALGLALPLTNRTVFAWASSGLETALWVALLAAWARAALGGQPLGLGLWAGLLVLTRPDGLLYGGLTALWLIARHRRQALVPLLGFLPALAHLLWRRATYGVWLPNPYYAKVGEAWPAAGLRHFALFALEYAAFAWPALWALGLRARRPAPGLLLVAGAVGAHAAYYVLDVGGDHFEHRIFLPVLWAGWAAAVCALPFAVPAPRAGLMAGALLVALSWPIPWTHHLLTRGLDTRGLTHALVEPVSPRLPWAGPWAGAWDALQSWLIPRMIAVRHAEHRVFGAVQARRLPAHGSVARGRLIDGGSVVGARFVGGSAAVDLTTDPGPLLADIPVVDLGTAGAGWFLFPLPVIDVFGLNDPLIARAGFRSAERVHAHEIRPPRGYVDCFRPNVYPAVALRPGDGAGPRTVLTPGPAWLRAIDIDAPDLPPPPAAPPGLRVEAPAVLIVAREMPLGPAGVAACTAAAWTAPPADDGGSPVAELERAAAESAARRAAWREAGGG
jgi:arabinofuranosyltransferase